MKYDSRNLDACSLTHRFAFSLLSAIAAGLEADFCRRAAAAAVEDRPPLPAAEAELCPSFLPSTAAEAAALALLLPEEDFTHLAGCSCDSSDDVRSAKRDLRDGVAGPSAKSEGGDEPYRS